MKDVAVDMSIFIIINSSKFHRIPRLLELAPSRPHGKTTSRFQGGEV
jgi:hypothetical protein